MDFISQYSTREPSQNMSFGTFLLVDQSSSFVTKDLNRNTERFYSPNETFLGGEHKRSQGITQALTVGGCRGTKKRQRRGERSTPWQAPPPTQSHTSLQWVGLHLQWAHWNSIISQSREYIYRRRRGYTKGQKSDEDSGWGVIGHTRAATNNNAG